MILDRVSAEAVLRMGPPDARAVLILPPLFEEANRTRRLLVEVMRALASLGIASVLPDLPGMNDSPVATVDARFEGWLGAVAEVAATLGEPIMTVALRGGALLDGVADFRWRLSPESGARLLRDMVRATAMTAKLKAADLDARARTQASWLAGSLIDPALYCALDAAVPTVDGPVRTVRLDDDAAPADARLAGTPLWRRAEPGEDAVMAAAMAADVAAWVLACAAR